MKNIHVLPTDRPSRLVKQKYDTIDRLCLADMATKKAEYKRFNLYITSNEEIKEGDWILFQGVLTKALEGEKFSGKEKIILVTDQDLIKEGVQAIDDEFLEWFIKNQGCESVEVNKSYSGTYYIAYPYKIIIPKEESKFEDSIINSVNIMSIANSMFGKKEEPKQEILLEDIFNIIDDEKCRYSTEESEFWYHYKIGVLDGLKWHQERSYSEEDMIEFGEWMKTLPLTVSGFVVKTKTKSIVVKKTKQLLEIWFEQFKKK